MFLLRASRRPEVGGYRNAGAFFIGRAALFEVKPSRKPHSPRSLNMAMDQEQQGKILRGTEGLGVITPQIIEERAREIARSDGRAEANDLDRTRARKELTGATAVPEQPATVGEPDSDWYTPRGSSGEKVPTVHPEDEENIPEKLIQEGIDEADHDQRSKSGRTRK